MDNCSNAEQKLSNAVVQTKVVNCNSANKSCQLQLVHTKAIAASTQFCDFSFLGFYSAFLVLLIPVLILLGPLMIQG